MGHPDDRLETLDPLRAKLGKPVNMDGEEQLEYGWYLDRGQKLVRQENWDKLGQEIRQFDEMRATTSGGSPISEILTLGARYDVIRPLEVALRFRESERLGRVLTGAPKRKAAVVVLRLALEVDGAEGDPDGLTVSAPAAGVRVDELGVRTEVPIWSSSPGS